MLPINKYVFVNQNFVNLNCLSPSMVHINPNFKQTVHINPNFKKPSIHINPQILVNNNHEIGNVFTEKSSSNKRICENQLNLPRAAKKLKNNNDDKIILTRTKFVRVSTKESSNINVLKKPIKKSLCSKYKIVRTERHNVHESNEAFATSHKDKMNKIVVTGNITPFKFVRQNRSLSSYSTDSHNVNKMRSKFIRINGILYKKSPNVLKKARLCSMAMIVQTNSKKLKKVVIGGNVCKTGPNKKFCTFLSVRDKKMKVLNLKNQGVNRDCTKSKARRKEFAANRNNKSLVLRYVFKFCNLCSSARKMICCTPHCKLLLSCTFTNISFAYACLLNAPIPFY